MRYCRHPLIACLVGAVVASLPNASAFSQQVGGTPQPSTRALAEGVLTVIPPDASVEETFTGPVEMVEIVQGIPNLDWNPHFLAKSDTLLEMAKHVVLRRNVWCLEFAFKPMRMIEVDIPQPNGAMKRKLVWYMVYRVRNLGQHLALAPKDDGFGNKTFETGYEDSTHRFFPEFALRSHEFDKEYLDQFLPSALAPIRQREKIDGTLLNSVQMTTVNIPVHEEGVDRSVWGVATWTDLDPRIDYFSIFVRGLTNAHKFTDKGGFQPGDPPATGRQFVYKTLQLNFWRPGDTDFEHEEEIRFGVPTFGEEAELPQQWAIYGVQEPLDYVWVYR